MAEVTMPRLSDTMTEGTIARWLKHEGDKVEKGDILLEIETDKATMELEAYEAGVVEQVMVQEGQTVQIGEPIARIGSGDGAKTNGAATQEEQPPAQEEAPTEEESPAPPAAARKEQRQEPKAEAEAQVVAPGDEGAPTTGEGDGRGDEAVGATRASPATEAERGEDTDGVRASPMARRIARERGIDLRSIKGSGPGGRVIRADVEGAEPGSAGVPPAPAATSTGAGGTPALPGADQDVEEIPLTNIRRITAKRMVESTTTVPHFFLTSTADVTELVALRKQINERLEAAGDQTKITINDLIVKASALAIRAMPDVNVAFAGDKILKKKRIHIGIAVALENGLIVPVIRDADQKSLGQIAREARSLSERARAGKLTPADYTGGTFTISNLGMFGIEQFSAVINTPEAAILAVGAATAEAVVVDGNVAVRERMHMTLSVDHRALDGATGARYLQVLKGLLEAPMRILV